MPAIAAPTQPRRHRQVTMAPAMITPERIDKKAYLNFNPSRKAAIDPVQAPVMGRGIATKSINPILSYLSIVCPRRLVRSKTQLTTLCPIPTRLTALASDSKNNKSTGTGIKLPRMHKQKALYHGILNKFIATGRAPRSSTTGKADITIVISS